MTVASKPLLEVQGLSIDFHTRDGIVHAVRNLAGMPGSVSQAR